MQKKQKILFSVSKIWGFPAFLCFISYLTEYLWVLKWKNKKFHLGLRGNGVNIFHYFLIFH